MGRGVGGKWWRGLQASDSPLHASPMNICSLGVGMEVWRVGGAGWVKLSKAFGSHCIGYMRGGSGPGTNIQLLAAMRFLASCYESVHSSSAWALWFQRISLRQHLTTKASTMEDAFPGAARGLAGCGRLGEWLQLPPQTTASIAHGAPLPTACDACWAMLGIETLRLPTASEYECIQSS